MRKTSENLILMKKKVKEVYYSDIVFMFDDFDTYETDKHVRISCMRVVGDYSNRGASDSLHSGII